MSGGTTARRPTGPLAIGVIAGSTTGGIDPVLGRTASVTGTVTGPDGSPLAGISVQAYRDDPDEGWQYVDEVTTDAAGVYLLDEQWPGEVRLGFVDPLGLFAREFWDERATVQEADGLTLTSGLHLTGIDVQLGEGRTIGGTVTGDGAPLVEAVVVLSRMTPDGPVLYGETLTGADGTYSFAGLPDGSYRVGFRARGFVREWWSDKATLAAADEVLVAGADVGDVDAELGRGGAIAGMVTSDTGKPLGNVLVAAYANDGAGGWEYVDDATTDAAGSYASPASAPVCTASGSRTPRGRGGSCRSGPTTRRRSRRPPTCPSSTVRRRRWTRT